MTTYGNEFQEISHCGGQYVVTVKTDANGRKGIQLGHRHSRPTPVSVIGVYFLPQGIPVGMMALGGDWISKFSSCSRLFANFYRL